MYLFPRSGTATRQGVTVQLAGWCARTKDDTHEGVGDTPVDALADLVGNLEKSLGTDVAEIQARLAGASLQESAIESPFWKRTRHHMETLGSESLNIPVTQLKLLIEEIQRLRGGG